MKSAPEPSPAATPPAPDTATDAPLFADADAHDADAPPAASAAAKVRIYAVEFLKLVLVSGVKFGVRSAGQAMGAREFFAEGRPIPAWGNAPGQGAHHPANRAVSPPAQAAGRLPIASEIQGSPSNRQRIPGITRGRPAACAGGLTARFGT